MTTLPVKRVETPIILYARVTLEQKAYVKKNNIDIGEVIRKVLEEDMKNDKTGGN